jgi:hypothetical protein
MVKVYKRRTARRDQSLVENFGGGTTLLSSGSVRFTKGLAERWLTLPEVNRDRSLANGWVDTLVTAMERGTFLLELVQLASCDLEGTTYRINGQHCCWARLDTKSISDGKVAILKYEASDLESMAKLYASFDRGRHRVKTHVVSSYLGGEFDYLSQRMEQLLVTGMSSLLQAGTQQKMFDGDEVATQMLGPWNVTCHHVAKMIPEVVTQETQHMRRAPVMAAMLATTNTNPDKAVEFWRAVANGLGFLTPDTPGLRLRNWLMTSSIQGSGKGNRRQVRQEDMYRVCINLWNTSLAGREVQIVRVPTTRPLPD